jgi:hypothetical protein
MKTQAEDFDAKQGEQKNEVTSLKEALTDLIASKQQESLSVFEKQSETIEALRANQEAAMKAIKENQDAALAAIKSSQEATIAAAEASTK